METALLWMLRILDAGPEFYALLGIFLVLVWQLKGLLAHHKDESAKTLAANKLLWEECRTLSHRLEADNRHVMNKMTGGKAEVIKELRDASASLWKKYNQVDKLNYGTALAIQAMGGVKLIKQSADGHGDYALNHDIHTELSE